MSYWRVKVCWKSSALMIGLLISGVAQAQLSTAVLPLARSVQTNSTTSFSASYTNGGTTALSNCQTSLASNIPASLSSFDQAGNPLAPFSLAPAETLNLTLAITPSAAFASAQVLLNFVCEEAGGAPVEAPTIPGVNTIVLSASDTPTADVIALAATPSGDDILTADPSNAFSIATINLGIGAQITIRPNTGTKQLPLQFGVCLTDATGACDGAVAVAALSTTIDANETQTFAVFATSEGTIPPDPANNRIFVPFVDELGVVRGLTSVAVTSSVAPEPPQPVFPGAWRDVNDAETVCFNVSLDGTRLTPVGSNCEGGSSLSLVLGGLGINTPGGVPCVVNAVTNDEIQIVPATPTTFATFTWIQVLGGRNVAVFGQFEDPELLNIGGAMGFSGLLGLCGGVWTATPE